MKELDKLFKESKEFTETEKVHFEIVRDLLSRSLLFAYRGSKAHNMYVPNTDPDSIDDIDYMAVAFAPYTRYLGLKSDLIKTKNYFFGKHDVEVHEIRRFMNLLLKSNPNVIGMLWLKPHLYIKRTEAGNRLIENRHLFSSKRIYHSFTGYAHAQLHKMTHMNFAGYMGDKRKSLVLKHGYDTKNAAHCLRLLKMGIEFLNTGELHVWREDADKYLAIKRGEWELDQVKSEASRLFKLADEALARTHLPAQPDYDAAEKLCVEIMWGYLNG